MKLSEILKEDNITLDFSAKDKEEAIALLAESIHGDLDKDKLLFELMEREKLGSTGVGEGVALPHIRLESVDELRVAFGRAKPPIDFKSIDDEPCIFFFLIIAPQGEDGKSKYLQLMAKISRLMRNSSVRDKIKSESSPAGVLDAIREME